MPLIRELQWDELDLLQGVETIPTEGADGSLHYRLRHEGLVLLLSLWPHHGLVDVTLVQAATEAALLDLTVAVRGRIRYNNDKGGEYLAFHDCVLVSRLASSEEQLEAAFSPNAYGRHMTVATRPHLSVLFE
ncbi:hypothetical protein F0P96_07260 [Hymenobacter busanensis]|uniref:Uncharacterized protein n=1 Tax=Hymenobacter busanensis TaxID=2607656 RepID=A0A7L5A1I9_9BACT|nr:hypothetical protein [Hymenobacter busanensis]KAA9338615.1 hypothetical protein F0P96_07260 [Hymenobacter busanensis]QHJ08956.1 hypothetical protein GUY19_17340 [Hymenobacter busanensis]